MANYAKSTIEYITEDFPTNDGEKDIKKDELVATPSSTSTHTATAKGISLYAVGSVLVWMVLNITLQFYNKYLFSVENFKFPVLIIMCGTTATFLGTASLVYIFKLSELNSKELQNQWRMIFFLAILHGVGAASENISIVHISISLNQVIKATGPAFTLVLSRIFEGKHYSLALVLSTIVVVFGAVLTVFRNPEFNFFGFITAAISTLMSACQSIVIGKLLMNPKLNATSIALASALPSVATILPVFVYSEMEDLIEHGNANGVGKIVTTVTIISIIAFFYNLSHLWLIKYTSAHLSMLIGNCKVVILVFLSMLVFHTAFLPINLVGMVLAVIGFIVYSYFKYRENQHQHQHQQYEKLDISSDIELTLVPEKIVKGDSILVTEDYSSERDEESVNTNREKLKSPEKKDHKIVPKKVVYHKD
eukprot:TRINITY_DN2129_c0_g1_i1.p1 TRINITY_DN2129_c0_g1~~TRINITY_DN2129_c0_g1_i1.p1  ORF type:complete len:421 (-),score=57.71 TRINITY_DN2129_c0_g1_i1:33-1295(-)